MLLVWSAFARVEEITRGEGRVVPSRQLQVVQSLDGGVVAEKSDAAFNLVAVGPDGQPANLDVHWTVNRIETRYQWYSLYGQWNWEATTSRTRVTEGDLTLTASGPATVTAPI